MNSTPDVITSKYISNFSLICKKKNALNENAYVWVCDNFYEGSIEDFSTYMSTVSNLTEKIYNLERKVNTTTHISNITKQRIIDACSYFMQSDEYGIIKVILPGDKNIHYTELDCKEVRKIVSDALQIKYTSKEFFNE